MKKLLALVLALVMVLSFAACGESEAPEQGGNETEGLTAENIKIGFVHVSDPSDMGYTYNHDLGTWKMAENPGISPKVEDNQICARVLADLGYNVTVVKEQEIKDGNFPTVVSPNPENPEAMTMAINLAKKIDADLVLASDPDADRLAIACKDSKGEWVIINGNQTCMIFLYYIITQYRALGKMTGKEFVVKTIVTTEVIKEIAEKNDIKMYDCYTGFKWIAKVIRDNEGIAKYIGGGEESFGFLAEDFCRDKDAVSACSLIAEVAAWAKDNGKSLYELLMDIYVEYGFSKEITVNVVKPGKSGADEIRQMMENFRANPLKEMAGEKVVCYKDFKAMKQTDVDGNVTDIDMPEPSNVLQYFTESGNKVSVRPSGTEPKIKFYMEAKGVMKTRDDFEAATAAADALIVKMKEALSI